MLTNTGKDRFGFISGAQKGVEEGLGGLAQAPWFLGVSWSILRGNFQAQKTKSSKEPQGSISLSEHWALLWVAPIASEAAMPPQSRSNVLGGPCAPTLHGSLGGQSQGAGCRASPSPGWQPSIIRDCSFLFLECLVVSVYF